MCGSVQRWTLSVLALEFSRLNSKFSRVKVSVVVGYSPSEDVEEWGRLWNNMDRILDRVGNGYRLCILRDLNGWIGDGMRPGITAAFGVPEEWWSSVLKGDCV